MESGDFNVVATDPNGCEVEAAIFDVVAGISSQSGKQQFTLFPNPVSDVLVIQGMNDPSGLSQALSVSVYNMISQQMMDVHAAFINGKFELNVSRLARGMYWIEINTSGKTFRTKFVKD